MCGIAGFVDLRGRFHAEALRELATRMANTMLHRGPDDGGAWVDPTGYCAFSQRRLSIIDLSPAGHQPMQSSDGRTCITFNGEIYNFNDLRSELESNGRTLRTRTDTEVLLEAIRAYGTETFLKLDGMYAFAFFDEQTSDLILARDPFGEKPLYYTHQNGYFAFASELHALPVLPQFDATIDEEAIAQLFMLQYVHAPRTIYRSAKKLPPGHWLRLSRDGTIRIEQFYKFTPQSGPFEDRSLDDLADELKEILVRSVRRRMISDVPVGAFLSGGVDSSLVVALIARELGHKVKTFSIGFDKAPESEHLFARQMAERLGTDHHDKILAPDILNLATMIGQILDEPNGDSSCLPTYLISEFARRQVTVSLSGDGGDELFGGYGRYFATLQEAERVRNGEKDLAAWWSPGAVYYGNRICVFPENDLISLLGYIPPETKAMIEEFKGCLNNSPLPLLGRMREIDTRTYMPGAVLPKVDRMSMQHALEVRCPFLSLEVARFAEKLSPEQCYSEGQGKLVLKKLASRYVPMEWLTRPKMGFGLPMSVWGQRQLMSKVRDLCLGASGRSHCWIPHEKLEEFITKHSDPARFATYQVWSLLILELWLRSHPVSYSREVTAPKIDSLSTKEKVSLNGDTSLLTPFKIQKSAPLTPSARALLELVLNRSFSKILVCADLSAPQGLDAVPVEKIFYTKRGSVITDRNPLYREGDWSLSSFWEALSGTTFGDNGAAIFCAPFEEINSRALSVLAEAGVKIIVTNEDNVWTERTLQSIATLSKIELLKEKVITKISHVFTRARLALARRILRIFSHPLTDGLPESIGHQGEHSYFAQLPALTALGNTVGKGGSCLLLFENETLLSGNHSHRDISQLGGGRYMHWESGVYFSSTDGTDPRTNGRAYRYILAGSAVTLCRKLKINVARLFASVDFPLFISLSVEMRRTLKIPLVGRPRRIRTRNTNVINFEQAVSREIELEQTTGKPRGFTRFASPTNKIALFTASLAPGGAERQLCYLAAELEKRGLATEVFTHFQESAHNLHYYPLLKKAQVPHSFISSPHPDFDRTALMNKEGLRELDLLESLPNAIAEEVRNLYTHLMVLRPKILHCFLDQPNITGAIAGWLAGVPKIILSTRNVNPTHFSYIYQEWFETWYKIMAKCPRVALSGNSIAGIKSYASWLNLPSDQFCVIHNGLRFDTVVSPSRELVDTIRKELSLSAETPVVLGVFRLSKEKEPFVFVDTIEQIKKSMPSVRALIAGIGPLEEKLHSIISKKGLSDTITLLGRREDISTLMTLADVVVLTSEQEGLPNVLMEAQWLERPVVATAVGGVPEVVVDGVTGYLCKRGDVTALAEKTLSLLQDSVGRARLGKAGKAHIVNEFSVNKMVEKTLSLYGIELATGEATEKVKATA